jgi:hypothetical protein
MVRFFSAAAILVAASGASAGFIEANVTDGCVTSPTGLTRVGAGAGFGQRDINAATYGTALLGQSSAGAAYVTNVAGRNTLFTYGNGTVGVHGTLLGSNSQVNVQSVQGVVYGPNTLRVVVACYTIDNTNLWLSGLTIGGKAMTQGRLDVGGGAALPALTWDNAPGPISSVSIFSALWSPSNGFASPLATSTALTNAATLPSMGAGVVWTGVVGYSGIISEIDMIFDITFTPAPGAVSAFAMAGVFAARRRRS